MQKEPKLPFLQVALGDEVIDIKTNKTGFVHRKKLMGFTNWFLVKWNNGKDKDTAFTSRKDQQTIKRTGRNIHDSDSESD